ncbi:MAG: hypothetical protein WD960_09745 [Gemmatimonadota bacterium]
MMRWAARSHAKGKGRRGCAVRRVTAVRWVAEDVAAHLRAALGVALLLGVGAAGVALAWPGSLAAQERGDTIQADTLRSTLAQEGIYNRPFIADLGVGASRTAIGGYAEANTNYFRNAGVPEGFSVEFRRFNIFLFSSLSRRLRFISELEFEHGTEEIALETALLDIELWPSLVLRGGILLPPLGYFNQNHDSPQWNFVERPLVSTELIPATLSEVGFGVHGQLFPGRSTVSYDLYLTNGLQAGVLLNAEGRTHIPSGKDEAQFGEDNNGSPALSGRVALSRPGLGEVGASVYTAIYNTFEMEGDPVADPRRLAIWALDAQGTMGPLALRTEWALATVDVPDNLADFAGNRQWGAHLDLSLPVWRPEIGGWEAAVLSADLRLEHLDWNVGAFAATGRRIGDEVTAFVPGLAFRPVSGTVIRANYRREWWTDPLANPAEIRAGWQVGLATYF